QVGVCTGTARVRGKEVVSVALAAPLARGDGLLVEGSFANQGEVGGRVWSLFLRGADVERAGEGESVDVWLGPEKATTGAAAGRRVWKTSDPSLAPEIKASLERSARRVKLDVHVSGKTGELPLFEALTQSGERARVTGDAKIECARGAGLD